MKSRRIWRFRRLIQTIIAALLLVTLPFSSLSAPYFESKTIYRAEVRAKVVAITFDDGPHPVYTPQLLDVLDEYGVKATFFMIGSIMERYPDIVTEVSSRGHIIGNHTYHHPLNMKILSEKEILNEIQQWEQVREKIGVPPSSLFRPPRGVIGGKVLSTMEKAGYSTVLWSICGNNKNAVTPELMAERVQNKIAPGGIILLHDGVTDIRWMDVEASKLIIESLMQEGYRFVTVPDLLNIAADERIRD